MFTYITSFNVTSNQIGNSIKPIVDSKFDVGGFKLYMACYGKGSNTIILESGYNGYGTYEEEWQKIIPELSLSNKVCLYDRAGLGESDKGPVPYSVKEASQRLHTLLEKANITPPYLMVGHSWGNFHIRMYNHLYPGEVKGALFIDSPTYTNMYKDVLIREEWDQIKYPYTTEALKRDHNTYIELWDNPLHPRNEEGIDLKLSQQQIMSTSTFGDLPLIWFKSSWGVSNMYKKSPKGWPAEYWQKDRIWQAYGITSMKQLSSNFKYVKSSEGKHSLQWHDPDSTVKLVKELILAINNKSQLIQ